MDDDLATMTLELTAGEVELIRTALQMLEDTLTREEADELAEVKALLMRLPAKG